MISRIGTFSSATSLVTQSLTVQAQLNILTTQEASGQKSATYGGLATNAGSLLDITGQSTRLKAETAAATTAGNVVQTAYASVGDIANLATTIRTQLSAALNGTTASSSGSPITATSVNTWLNQLQTDLNTQVGGQYVFSGQAADRQPVNFASANYTPTASPTTPNTGYYNGSSTPTSLMTSDGTSLQVSVPASDPGFEQLARALSLVAANPTNQATLQQAYDMVGTAVSNIAQTQATLSLQAQSLSTLASSDTAKTTTLDNIAGTINGADLTTTTVMITQYQTQLQALYSSIGQLSQLSLTKYVTL